MSALVMFLTGLAVWLLSVLFCGYTFVHLWQWFVVPLGVVPVTLPWALGLSLFVSLAKGWPEGGENEKVAVTLLKPFAVYAAALLLGYVFHLYM